MTELLEYVTSQVEHLIDQNRYEDAMSLYSEWREHFIEIDEQIEVITLSLV
jgi:hypothetical protein